MPVRLIVRLVLILIMLSTLILSGLDAMSSSPYYWLREGVYFLYDVRSDSRASCKVTDYSSGYWFMFPFNDLKVKWSVLRVEGEWMFVNFSMIAFNAKNLNTSESLNYVISRVFKVNLRTLQAYTRWDVYEEFWAKEWPFLLRPEQSLGGTVKLFKLRVVGPMFGIQSDRPWHDVRVKPVLDEINETIVRLTRGNRSLKDYMRVIHDDERTVFFYINVIPRGWSEWTEGRQLGLTLGLLALNPPPAERGYSYSNITLDRVRLVRGAPLDVFREFEKAYTNFTRLYGNLDEIAGIYNFTTYLKAVQGELYTSFMVVVDRRGDVYAVLPAENPRVEEVIYDSISGVLVYAKFKDRGLLSDIARWFEFSIREIGVSCGVELAERSVELLLFDTNIVFERPVIGAPITPPKTTVEEPTGTTTTPARVPEPRQIPPATTPQAQPPSRLPIALVAFALLLLLALVVALRYRGR
ncbi:MAG: hypothetical protein RRE21_00135 [Desulfurococcales archaeon]|jgi:hypothetical protein|nr:hypothetical protein [Desulfurococcales archaeon]